MKKAAKRKTKNHGMKAEIIAMQQKIAELRKDMATKATKSDVADVEAKMASGFQEVKSDIAETKTGLRQEVSGLRQEFQAKIDSIHKRYDKGLGKMGNICQRVLNHLLEHSSAEDLREDSELIEYLIDSLEFATYMDEVSFICVVLR